MPRSAFRPRPNVESAFLTFVRRPRGGDGRWQVEGEELGGEDYAAMVRLVRHAFGQRRKQLGTSLAGSGLRARRRCGTRSLPAGAAPAARPEELTPAAWVRFARVLGGCCLPRRPLWPRRLVRPGGPRDGRGRAKAGSRVAAPAKVNLALLVGPLRADGFHEIASLELPVTLADVVTVTPAPGAGLTVTCEVCPGEQNLAARLVRELEARLERQFEVAVDIRKQIPSGAGLGGGSSDAAATLVALERLYDLDLSWRLRYEVAVAVGSDVPFFLWPGPQLAMGRGQLLKDVLPARRRCTWSSRFPSLEPLDARGLRVARRGRAAHAARVRPPRAHALEPHRRGRRRARRRRSWSHNDLEASVVARRPQVGALRDGMAGGGRHGGPMTGSGSAVFGLFADEDVAGRARARLLDGGHAAQAFVVSDLQPAAHGKLRPGAAAPHGAAGRWAGRAGRGTRRGARRAAQAGRRGGPAARRGGPPRRRPRSR